MCTQKNERHVVDRLRHRKLPDPHTIPLIPQAQPVHCFFSARRYLPGRFSLEMKMLIQSCSTGSLFIV